MNETEAVIMVGTWYSRCTACNRNADPYEETHAMERMEGEGCGARYVKIGASYTGITADDLNRMRPDLPVDMGTIWPQVTP